MKRTLKTLVCVLLAVCAAAGLFAESGDSDDGSVYLPVYFSVLPGNPFGMKVTTSLAAGLLLSTVYELDGFQAAPIMSIVDSTSNGFQFSGIGSLVGNELNGGQFSGIFSIAGNRVNGLQASGLFNISGGTLTGYQGAGMFNISNGDTRWAQTAGVFNITNGRAEGLQAAGVFNIADGGVSGIQLAGVFNIAGDVDGVQASGVLNIARKVHGVQIGLINISDEMYGLPIGLVNIVKHGIFDFSVWEDETGFVYTGVQKGSSNLYVLLYGGAPKDDWFESAESLTTGLGLGTRFRLGSLFIDADASVKHLTEGDDAREQVYNMFNYHTGVIFPSFRATGGINLLGRVGLFGGVTLDCYVPGYSDYSELFHTADDPIEGSIGGTDFTLYPKWYLGVKF